MQIDDTGKLFVIVIPCSVEKILKSWTKIRWHFVNYFPTNCFILTSVFQLHKYVCVMYDVMLCMSM